MRTDEEIVEAFVIRPQRYFVVRALVEVVPSQGIQFRFGPLRKIEDINQFEEFGEFAVLLVGAQDGRRS